MNAHSFKLALGAVFAAGALTFAGAPAQAQTALQQCSAKYQAAKTANSLGGQSWNQFRTACLNDAKAQPAAATAPAAAPAATNPLRPTPAAATAAAPKPAATPAALPAGAANAVFPKAIDPKYAKESAGKQRQKTCLDQYNANKANNGNGGLNWIQKGGGYYSVCNNKLKGA